MRRPRLILVIGIAALLVLGGSTIHAAPFGEPAPLSTAPPDPAIRERIRAFEAGTARVVTDMTSFVGPDDRPVYLFDAPCCDRFNPLYDGEGRFICSPTGGIAGAGDGRCPDWVRSRRQRLPAHAGKQPSAPR